MATVIGETIANVFCVVRTRRQMASSPDLQGLRPTDSMGIRCVFSNLIHETGIRRALFRGLHIKLFTVVPMSAVSKSILEFLSSDRPVASN